MSRSYLAPGTGADGAQLWVVTVNDDGTSGATELLDFYPGSSLSAFSPLGSGGTVLDPHFTRFGDGVLFVAAGLADLYDPASPDYGKIAADGSATGRELWFTDGTAAGTHIVYDVSAGTHDAYNPSTYQTVSVGNDAFEGSGAQLVSIDGDTALFVAKRVIDAPHRYLFATNGTSDGTEQIAFDNFVDPSDLQALNGKALFTATIGSGFVSYLFATDGTVDGTQRLSDETNILNLLTTQSASGVQQVLFSGDDTQLWITDGATATRLTAGTPVIQGAPLIDLGGGNVLFFALPNEAGVQLWITNGTASGTAQVVGNLGGGLLSGGLVGVLTPQSGSRQAFFEVSSGSEQRSLFLSDGSAAGTRSVASWSGDAGFDSAVSGSNLFFGTVDNAQNIGLSVTDGGTGGVRQVAARGVTMLRAGPSGTAVFQQSDTNGGTALFITDGSVGSARALTGSGLSNFSLRPTIGSHLFFTADENTNAGLIYSELFSVGAAGAAVKLEINGDSQVRDLTAVGNELFFNASKASGETESWLTDGTQAGTHLVQGGGAITAGTTATPFITPLPCFLAGTRLRTPHGEIAVESLREGDVVLTASGAAAPIVWIGQREVDLTRHPAPRRVAPVRIRRGAFGDNLPTRDLLLSPDHAVAIDGVLIPVQHLIDGCAIAQETPASAHYFHIELPVHDVVLAEGLAVESYLDTGNRANFADAERPMTLHPDFWALHWDGACAPLVVAGPLVEAARARLRAGMGMLAAA